MNLKLKSIICLTFVLLMNVRNSPAQPMQNLTPMIGAEVFIEPGQTPEAIDLWFKTMKDHGMTICRIRMFETYMRKEDGSWDHSLFDMAYKAGEKYGIKIWGNLFPYTEFTDVGGFKFPRSEQHLKSISEYIKNLVEHYKQFKSHYGWVLINEPGSGRLPDEAFTKKMFQEWKAQNGERKTNQAGYPVFPFSEERFLVDYNTWFLQWLKDEVYKYDPGSHLHVNNHAIFQNVAEYDFPAWSKMLNSLGGSAHASWHFGYFTRKQYSVAMSANCEIVRSGAVNIPWLMTEIQGGNNTYSGYNALCPTKEEISQWLWTVVGSGGKGGIFWSLNPRASGFEAGEWAMVDFQNKPSDRLIAAGKVAGALNANSALFANARVLESGINILYIRESLWVEKKQQTGGPHLEGRDVGGVMKSALAYFEALGEMGVQSNLKEINEFDFSAENYKGKAIILAHQVAIPSRYWKMLENFVHKGGKLIVDGLTAYYDENAHCIMQTGFPFEKCFGAGIKEFKLEGNIFNTQLKNPALSLPGHCWRGYMYLSGATPIGTFENETIATRNKFGAGEVVWIPSLVGLAGRIEGYAKLQALLNAELPETLLPLPIRFKTPAKLAFMKLLKSGDAIISVIINKNNEPLNIELSTGKKLTPTVLYSEVPVKSVSPVLKINSEETVVIKWE